MGASAGVYWDTKYGPARVGLTLGTLLTHKCSRVKKVKFKKQPTPSDVSKKHIFLFHRILDSQGIICAALFSIRRLLIWLQGCAGQQSICEDAWEWKCSGQEANEFWCPCREGSWYSHDPSALGVTAVMNFHQSPSWYGPETALYYF